MEVILDMKTILSANLLDNRIYTQMLTEMANNIDELENDLIEFGYPSDITFTEARVRSSQTSMGQVLSRTGETVKGTAKLYNQLTDAGGDTIYHSAKLGVRILGWMVKLIGFIIDLIGNIPLTINNMINKLAAIGREVYNELTGHIGLYVTLEDIEYFETTIRGKIEDFILACTMFNNSQKGMDEKKIKAGEKFYKEMKKIHVLLINIKFEKTSLSLKSDQVKKIYFDQSGSYYGALKKLDDFFIQKKEMFIDLQKMLNENIGTMKVDGTFFKLSEAARLMINDSISTTGKVMTVIGNLFKHISDDLKTIDQVIVKLTNANK